MRSITDRISRVAIRAACAAVTLLLSATGEAAVSPPPTPRVTSAPHGQHGFPYLSTVLDLAKVGYVEEEYFVAGTAQAYVPVGSQDLSTDGRWNSVAGASSPYVTRIDVRRPLDPARFNGTVVVEWFNESGDTDAPYDWIFMHEEILRQGYAYVGVTVQYAGVQSLLAWETGPGARYATLFHPGDSFAYSIFAQSGWAIAHPRAGDPRPLGALTDRVRSVLATGFSQSAFWLVTYINAVHRLAPVYDGFLVHDGGVDENLSLSAATNDGAPSPPGVPATTEIDTPYPFRMRTDQSVPVLLTLSEFGLSDYGNGGARSYNLQPDTDHIRIWDLAGAAHVETDVASELNDDVNKSVPGSTIDPCDGPLQMPGLVQGNGGRAALRALKDWVADGRPPPSAPRLSLQVPNPPDNFNALVVFNRDPATNLAIGGVRLPAIAVPIATLDGNRSDLDMTAQGPGGQCYFIGSYDPWDHDTDSWDRKPGLDPSPDPEPDLLSLYPTHLHYVWRVGEAAARSVAAGQLLPDDAARIVTDAAKAPVP